MSKAPMQILLCVDLKSGSTAALARALTLSVRLRAQLHLCHIVKGIGSVAAPSIGLDDPEEVAAAQEARQQLRAQLSNLGGSPEIQIHVRSGRPVEEILRLIDELHPDIVLMSRPVKERFKRVQLGALTRQLAARSPAAVMIVPTQ